MSAERAEQPELFLVSDGTGETAGHAVLAAATQFQTRFRVHTFGDVRHEATLRRIVERAAQARGLIVFTLVNESLTQQLRSLASAKGVPVVDLLGPLISAAAKRYGLMPQFRPGLLHSFSEDYFQRVEAVEFAVHHDDGANLHSLFQADIVLVGVSRTGKTPLSMYLAQRGYRTGNVPIVPGIDPPRELLEIDPAKVVGMVVDASTLLDIRRARMRQLHAPPYLTYADADALRDELRRARRLFSTQGWRCMDVTGRAVEENAARVIEHIQSGQARD